MLRLTSTTLGNFVEVALAFYSILAAALAVAYWKTRAPVDAAWAGVFAGAAAGTKYAGVLTGGVIMLGLLVVLIRRPRLAAVVIGLAVAVALPWNVKNAIVAGNPAYPFYFGGKYLDADAGAVAAAGAGTEIAGGLRSVSGVSNHLVRIPGVVLLVLAALGLLLAGRTRLHLALAAGASVYTGLWLYYSPQGRFYLPAFGVIAALGGLALAALVSRGRVGAGLAVVAVAIAVAGWLATAGPYIGTYAPVAFGFEKRAQFANRMNGVLAAYGILAQKAPGGPVAITGTSNAYEYPFEAILLGRPEFDSRLPDETLLRRFLERGVRYVIAPTTADDGRFGCLEERGTAQARKRWEPLAQEPEDLPLAIYSVEPCYASLGP